MSVKSEGKSPRWLNFSWADGICLAYWVAFVLSLVILLNWSPALNAMSGMTTWSRKILILGSFWTLTIAALQTVFGEGGVWMAAKTALKWPARAWNALREFSRDSGSLYRKLRTDLPLGTLYLVSIPLTLLLAFTESAAPALEMARRLIVLQGLVLFTLFVRWSVQPASLLKMLDRSRLPWMDRVRSWAARPSSMHLGFAGIWVFVALFSMTGSAALLRIQHHLNKTGFRGKAFTDSFWDYLTVAATRFSSSDTEGIITSAASLKPVLIMIPFLAVVSVVILILAIVVVSQSRTSGELGQSVDRSLMDATEVFGNALSDSTRIATDAISQASENQRRALEDTRNGLERKAAETLQATRELASRTRENAERQAGQIKDAIGQLKALQNRSAEELARSSAEQAAARISAGIAEEFESLKSEISSWKETEPEIESLLNEPEAEHEPEAADALDGRLPVEDVSPDEDGANREDPENNPHQG